MRFALRPLGGSLPEGDSLTPEEEQALGLELGGLLVRQAGLYTMGDSTSLPEETARALLASLCFTLDLYRAEACLPRRALLTGDPEAHLTRAREVLAEKVAEARKRYQSVCAGLPPLENSYLTETLAEIGRFFRRYDPRFFAHRIPCSIDYPLCHPVPESLQGVDYVLDYLSRLELEHALLARFAPEELRALLRAAHGEYRTLPLNLCRPVLDCALGLALLGDSLSSLAFPAERLTRLAGLLDPMPGEALAAALRQSAASLARRLGGGAPRAEDYLARSALELFPRLRAAGTPEGLRGIFPWAG